MKKLLSIVAALAMVVGLAACKPSSFSSVVDDDGIHIVAEGKTDGFGDGTIVIEEGYGLCVNHIVNEGSFHVKATDESGNVIIDKDLTDNIADTVPAQGTINVTVTAKDADGTVDVIPYDLEAFEMSESTLGEALEDTDVDPESMGIANPWTEVKSAQEAADGAGLGNFNLPEEGMMLEGGPVNFSGYQYTKLLAEADGFAGAADLVVRKGVKNPAEEVAYDTSDVSGDYNNYAYSWDVTTEFWTVKCFGNVEGQAKKAIWQSDNFSYSISVTGQGDLVDTYGLGDNDIVTLVETIE